MNHKMLIIGKVPPPIGGVTIHTSRLLDLCDELNINYKFYDLQKFNLFSFLNAIRVSHKSHLHANNPLLLFLYSVMCLVFNNHSIITIHGDMESYNPLLTSLEKAAIRFCKQPIVLNDHSLEKAKKINSRSIKLSAFIPPIKSLYLSLSDLGKIALTGKIGNVLFCTNAYDYVFDKNGDEIYGVLPLIDCFNKSPEKRLVVSDPKGSYLSFLKKNNFFIKPNITFLSGNHSFFEVLKLSSCFIRNTSTDGDSLSVKEALYLGKSVIATDCVERPDGVRLIKFKDDLSLENAINEITLNHVERKVIPPSNGGIDIIALYK
tara:strand:+ start:1307 stop:2263 length:957 start_codon:yes stop_codon:yes gene_type:complete